MNKIKFWGFIAATVFAFASCDFVNDVKEAVDDIQDDQEAQYTESEDGLEITVSYKKSGIGIYHIANFRIEGNDTICTSLVTKTTYFTEAIAREAYNQAIKDMDEKDKARIKLEGKAIIVSHPENIGQKIAVIRLGLMVAYQGYKKGGEIVNNIEFPSEGEGGGVSGQTGQTTLNKFNAQFDESEEGLTLTLAYWDHTQSVARVRVASFEANGSDTLCINYAFSDTYMREDIAQYEFEQHYQNYDSEYRYTINGAIITHVDPDYVGFPKARIKQQMLYDYDTMTEMDNM